MNDLLPLLNNPFAKLLLAVLALYILWKIYRRWIAWQQQRWFEQLQKTIHDEEIPADLPTLSNGGAFIENTLKEWQCDYKKEEDEDDPRTWFHFVFHGVAFCIIFNKKTGISHIVMRFGSYPVKDYPIVRAMCNSLNGVSILWTASYTLNEAEGAYVIYLSAPLNCPAHSEVVFRRVLTYVMIDFTSAAESLKAREESLRANPLSNYEADLEHTGSMIRHDAQQALLAEYEIFKQGTRGKEMPNKLHFTLHDLLDILCIPANPQKCTLHKVGEENDVLYDETALATQLSTFLIDSSDAKAPFFFSKEAALICEAYYAEANTPRQRFSLTLTAERETDSTLYYRLHVLRLTEPVSPDAPFNKKRSTLRAYSWLLAYDKKDENELRAKARYFIEEAEEKLKTGKEATLTADEQILLLADSAANKRCLFNALALFRDKRYAEAVIFFENAFNALKEEGEVRQLTKTEIEATSRLAYYIGFCYNMLKQYKLAYFYLDTIYYLNNVEYSTQYILSLAGEKDPRTAFAVDHCLEQVQAYENGLDGEEMNSEVFQFKTFLLRQKVNLLVDAEQFAEAEKYLNTLQQIDPNSEQTRQEVEWFKQQANKAKPSSTDLTPDNFASFSEGF